MEINKVNFGNYTMSSFGAGLKGNSKKEEEQAVASPDNSKLAVNPEKMSEDMNIMGLQNKFLVNKADNSEINPAKFLNEARIADIQALMGEFDKNTELFAKEFEELGFSGAEKDALAAYAFTKDVNNAEVVISQE